MTWDHLPLIWNSPIPVWCSSTQCCSCIFTRPCFRTQWLSQKMAMLQTKWKSIPTIYRRVMMFGGRGNPVTSHPFLRVNSQLVLLSIVVSFTPLISPHISFYWFLERRRKGEREKHLLVDSCHSPTRDWTHNLGSNCHPLVHQPSCTG